METEIWFYDPKEKPWGIFSNFTVKKFKVDDTLYFTSEAYFQSQKFSGKHATKIDLEYAKLVAEQKTGGKPAVLARQVKPRQNYPWAKDLWVIIQDYLEKGVKIRDDWQEVKDNIMRRGVYQKFLQNPSFRAILKSTLDKPIFEHTHRDHYWADGHPYGDPTVHGDGKNMLGRILMETRYLLDGVITRGTNNNMGIWLIPEMLLVSDHKPQVLIKNGIRYVINDNQEPGCKVENNTLFANWGDNLTASKLKEVAKTIATSIGKHFPVAISKHRARDVAKYVFKEIYGDAPLPLVFTHFEDNFEDISSRKQDLSVLKGMSFKEASRLVKKWHPRFSIDRESDETQTEEYRIDTIRLYVDRNNIVTFASYN